MARYVYRVIQKVSYYEKWHEFGTGEKACEFAETLLKSQVPNEDHKKKPLYINIVLVDKEAEAAAKAAEEADDANA